MVRSERHRKTAAICATAMVSELCCYDDDDDDFILFQVHLLDNYKDRSPGLHVRTLPFLGPTVCIYDDDDDDFSLFKVRHLDIYKDQCPGLHIRTLPL